MGETLSIFAVNTDETSIGDLDEHKSCWIILNGRVWVWVRVDYIPLNHLSYSVLTFSFISNIEYGFSFCSSSALKISISFVSSSYVGRNHIARYSAEYKLSFLSPILMDERKSSIFRLLKHTYVEFLYVNEWRIEWLILFLLIFIIFLHWFMRNKESFIHSCIRSPGRSHHLHLFYLNFFFQFWNFL